MRKILKKGLGVLLIILGLLALLTPFSPGSWLALIGLEILGVRVLLERKFSSLLSQKHRKALLRWRQKVKRIWPFARPKSGRSNSDTGKKPD